MIILGIGGVLNDAAAALLKDGVLSADEFLGPKDTDGKDGANVVVETRTIHRSGKDAAPAAHTPAGPPPTTNTSV